MNLLLRIGATLAALLMSGCVETRDPQPISTQHPDDTAMSCRDIETKYRSKTETAAAKIAKNIENDKQDAIVGFLIWPGLADFKNADGIEGNALLDRNIFLRELATQKGCDIANWPAQPKRYE